MARVIIACCVLIPLSCTTLVAPPTNRVRIDFDGASHAFQHCTLRSETDVIEVREGSGTVHRVPGSTKYSNVVCSRSITTDKSFWAWRKQIEQGIVTRKKLTIVYLDPTLKQELARFTIFNAWLAAAKITNGETCHPCSRSDTSIEEIEIVHEGIQRE